MRPNLNSVVTVKERLLADISPVLSSSLTGNLVNQGRATWTRWILYFLSSAVIRVPPNYPKRVNMDKSNCPVIHNPTDERKGIKSESLWKRRDWQVVNLVCLCISLFSHTLCCSLCSRVSSYWQLQMSVDVTRISIWMVRLSLFT